MVTLQPGLGAFPKQSVFFLSRSGIDRKHFMVCRANQMSIGQLLANEENQAFYSCLNVQLQ
jgi:hypothetical protein